MSLSSNGRAVLNSWLCIPFKRALSAPKRESSSITQLHQLAAYNLCCGGRRICEVDRRAAPLESSSQGKNRKSTNHYNFFSPILRFPRNPLPSPPSDPIIFLLIMSSLVLKLTQKELISYYIPLSNDMAVHCKTRYFSQPLA